MVLAGNLLGRCRVNNTPSELSFQSSFMTVFRKILKFDYNSHFHFYSDLVLKCIKKIK